MNRPTMAKRPRLVTPVLSAPLTVTPEPDAPAGLEELVELLLVV